MIIGLCETRKTRNIILIQCVYTKRMPRQTGGGRVERRWNKMQLEMLRLYYQKNGVIKMKT